MTRREPATPSYLKPKGASGAFGTTGTRGAFGITGGFAAFALFAAAFLLGLSLMAQPAYCADGGESVAAASVSSAEAVSASVADEAVAASDGEAAPQSTSSSGYVWPLLTDDGTVGGYSGSHIAIDICEIPEGTPVVAMKSGIVKYVQKYNENIYPDGDSGSMESYGNMVVLYHPADKTATLYAHLQTVKVKQGASVSQGDVIGLVGNTGYSVEAHLHFELRTGAAGDLAYRNMGTRVNPLDYVSPDDLYEAGDDDSGASTALNTAVETLEDGLYVIESAGADGLAIDVKGGTSYDGCALQIHTENGTAAQSFAFDANDDGTFCITNWTAAAGACVGLANERFASGEAVQACAYDFDREGNRWYVERTPEGLYSFRNAYSGLYLAVAGGSGGSSGGFANDSLLEQRAGDASVAQKFQLVLQDDELPEGACRLAGDNRYETAAQIALASYPEGAKGIVVATGEAFPDALGAAGLAGMMDYPVVLCRQDGIPEATREAIEGLMEGADAAASDAADSSAGASVATAGFEVIIVGGTAAVGEEAQQALEELAGAENVSRIAGEDRYGTADAVYVEGLARGTWGDTAIVATGCNYPDALSASAYAFAQRSPIFLCDTDAANDAEDADAAVQTALSAISRRSLSDDRFDTIVVTGGEAAVPQSVESWLDENAEASVVRCEGENRYETSAAIARFALGHGSTSDGACIATGTNFPDALAGCALAGKANSVILLAAPGRISALSCLGTDETVRSLSYLGGGQVVPQSIRSAAAVSAGW